jgi:hypothetical protein
MAILAIRLASLYFHYLVVQAPKLQLLLQLAEHAGSVFQQKVG